jgi:hypothetical protein
MPTYTVHAPPPRKGEATSAPERFVFVRDGFHVWAFLLTPFWLLRYRLWLAFVLYILVSVALAFALRAVRVDAGVQFLAGLFVSLLIGFEAASIRRFKLTRRGWTMLGFVVGEDLEMAERRFFAAWTEHAENAPPAPPRPVAPAPRQPPPDVIGLFPQAGSPR